MNGFLTRRQVLARVHVSKSTLARMEANGLFPPVVMWTKGTPGHGRALYSENEVAQWEGDHLSGRATTQWRARRETRELQRAQSAADEAQRELAWDELRALADAPRVRRPRHPRY